MRKLKLRWFAVMSCALLVVVLFASCEQKVEMQKGGVATVGFSTASSRGISGEIAYADPYSLTWNVTATKTDGGDTLGQGTTQNALLTDKFGSYATGTWTFMLEGFKEGVKIYEGSVDYTLIAGNNQIEIDLSPCGDTGTLMLKDCFYCVSEFKSSVGKLTLWIDDQDYTILTTDFQTEDNDTFYIPDLSYEVSAGIHDIKLFYCEPYGRQLDHVDVKVRVVGNTVTALTITPDRGSGEFLVTIDREDAITEIVYP